jgi:hypothetical protein
MITTQAAPIAIAIVYRCLTSAASSANNHSIGPVTYADGASGHRRLSTCSMVAVRNGPAGDRIARAVGPRQAYRLAPDPGIIDGRSLLWMAYAIFQSPPVRLSITMYLPVSSTIPSRVDRRCV